MLRQVVPLLGATGVTAFVCLKIVEKAQERTMARIPKTADAAFVVDSKKELDRLLRHDLHTKSVREKVSDAYDGAVRTHELGFPSIRPPDGE
mmetsp:Transcript_21394/g.62316  ORF Transcript_21394/g.62316 Transcript_21394/m.62316 type:complete len:92 (+) Transcript_21394:85-360(+)